MCDYARDEVTWKRFLSDKMTRSTCQAIFGWALATGHTAVLEQLSVLDSFNLNARLNYRSIRMFADKMILERLLRLGGFDINARLCRWQTTCLELAVKSRDLAVVKNLITCEQVRLMVNHRPIIHYAIEEYLKLIGRVRRIKWESELLRLLCSCERVNVNDAEGIPHGNTALIKIAFERSPKIMEVLLSSSNVDVDLSNHGGITALMAAILKNSISCVKLLLLFGADVHVKNPDGKTALQLAKKKGYLFFVEMIRCRVLFDKALGKLMSKSIFTNWGVNAAFVKARSVSFGLGIDFFEMLCIQTLKRIDLSDDVKHDIAALDVLKNTLDDLERWGRWGSDVFRVLDVLLTDLAKKKHCMLDDSMRQPVASTSTANACLSTDAAEEGDLAEASTSEVTQMTSTLTTPIALSTRPPQAPPAAVNEEGTSIAMALQDGHGVDLTLAMPTVPADEPSGGGNIADNASSLRMPAS